ncbi:MAG TPA: hypothetical protein VFV05_13710 [Methylomirabilota bacterium]|nr:hypothetical protein [Methylomirabilota bacterium]
MNRWIAVGVALLATACASVEPVPPIATPGPRASVPGFEFASDTFAFPNEIRARHRDRDDLYANYCFVLARGLRQFFAFARFEPGAPRLPHEAYVERVRAIAAQPPWRPAPAADDRVVIPGYASLREFSRAEEAAVKQGLGGRFWTLVHWTNWRVTFPVTRGHQAGVAREVMDELDAGRLVQLLVTNWPKPELNHTVVAYGYRAEPAGVEFSVWDPNDPGEPGVVRFDTEAGRFRASRLYDTEPGIIRAFRMYYGWLL